MVRGWKVNLKRVVNYSDDDLDYFDSDVDWPIDAPGYIFLGRAFHLLGHRMFSNNWDVDYPPCPSYGDWDADETWDTIVDQINSNDVEQYKAVQESISRWALSGLVRSALRAKSGGSLIEQPSSIWNFDRSRVRFFNGEMSAEDPFITKPWAHQTHFIFLRLDDFEKALQEVGKKPLNQAGFPAPKSPRGKSLRSVMEAVKDLWQNPPTHISENDRNEKINIWLRERGRQTVAPATIRRALKIMLSGSDGK